MDIHVSPSLQSPDRWASEVKFDVSPEVAAAVVEWATREMVPDVHGGHSADGAYHIQTLYLDTPESDVFLRSPGYRVSKFRVRRYETHDQIYLEQKKKRGCRVQKSRTGIAFEDLPQIATPDHPAQWFAAEVARLRLAPSCLVTYRRFAFNAMSESGPMRMTIDDHLLAYDANAWEFQTPGPGTPVMPGRCVLEVKFPEVLPKAFAGIIREHRLVNRGGSKYRFGHAALFVPTTEVRQCQSS